MRQYRSANASKSHAKCVKTICQICQDHSPNMSSIKVFLRTLPTCIKQQTPKLKCDTELLGSDDLKLLQLDRTINDLLRECYDPSKHEFKGTGRAPIHDQMSIIFQFLFNAKWFRLGHRRWIAYWYDYQEIRNNTWESFGASIPQTAQKDLRFHLLAGLLLSASNVLSSFPQAPRSGRGALRRGPERGLFHQNLVSKWQNSIENIE